MTDHQAPYTATMLYHLYHAATWLAAPLAARKVLNRLDQQGVSEPRQRERLGHATADRPEGRVLWFHGASVGESLSALTLITHLGDRLPDTCFLVTSGTATSAELIAKRLPRRTTHQFAALDSPGPVDRFLAHWQPDAAVFVESELWPLTLRKTRVSGAKIALVNARLSAKSARMWQKAPRTARFVLDQFSAFLTQNSAMAETLQRMGAAPDRIHPGTNLKAYAPALPAEPAALQELRGHIGDRPVWVASSTHPGEEEVVLEAHRALLGEHPDLLLILVPRHPDRAGFVADQIAAGGFTSCRRSLGDHPAPDTQVFLADTLGELGLWYGLSPIVFLGGSLRDIGGHNPFEPARSGCAVLTGPGVHNFAETFGPLLASGGAVETPDASRLAAAVAVWLTDAEALQTAREACQTFVDQQDVALDQILDTLCSALDITG